MTKELIAPCHSPYSLPAMLVLKKNAKLRLVIDYRTLNEQTIKSCWPISSLKKIFDTLQESAYFLTIDKSWGFYQLPMKIKCQNYTASSTPFASFKWLRMPMGLMGSPSIFQSLMEHVLVAVICNINVPYLDDCIIFYKTPEEHKKTATSFPKVSRRAPENQAYKMCLFPNEISVLRTCNQQKRMGSHSRKNRSHSKLPSTTKSNGC